MKRLFPCLAGLALLFAGLGQAVMSLPLGVSMASATTYDLAADWSDADNPNGVWTYREGTDALPSVADWTPLTSPVVQPAWAPSTAGGNFLPAWFKSTANHPADLDILVGDVVVHSTDAFNGQSSGVANVIWTSPINGVIDISGAVWITRDIGRGNTWTLLLNGVSLTSGTIFSGDPFNRADPFDFATGSGGPAVLNEIEVSPGDVIELRIEKTSTFGDFVGINLTIMATTNVTTVEIDIQPGSDANCVNINGNGVIPVAILGSAAFDVTEVDVASLKFAGLDVRVKGSGLPQCALEDVSGDFTSPEGSPDGYLDLVCQFVDDPAHWSPDDGTAKLTGHLHPEFGDTPIEGTDSICIVP
jgi:hypothetical protein